MVDPGDAFAGLSVILFGDFHQFPPVTRSKLALYQPTNYNKRAMIGSNIYRQFDTVVLLEKQNRVTDRRWMELLRNLRHGGCTGDDITVVESLQLTNPASTLPDFSSPGWKDAILVTSRRVVKDMWNEEALKKHSFLTGNRIYLAPAEDMIVRRHSQCTTNNQERLALAKCSADDTRRLPGLVSMSVGMRAMILLNIATEADIANGTRGTIEEIVLDPRESETLETDKEGRVKLQFPPSLVKFRPDLPTNVQFNGLEDGLILITPSQTGFSINICQEGAVRREKVSRRQFALTQAYAFTDYKSQGQTLPYVIVDLAPPPGRGAKLTPFNIYVALSRSRGRDTIRILRSFNETLFTTHPCPLLEEEDNRLAALAEDTKTKWNDTL
ncbi:hypothetical protein NP233_g6215 [Leucocoprinus birnbaumii]|uniref:ATP-dependent DNA helicase n=1 Tax=Leucocoprinus birnbaumii TaxID=56174 RepID=A0AAD5VRE2_9AGAR|nr:hypothetical protein NP233_g6215 [Leucocoprinus birnbaumii]